MKRFYLTLMFSGILAIALCTGCKAWRTVTTTSTYTQAQDSTKVTTTIQTKTQEEYTGVRKNR